MTDAPFYDRDGITIHNGECLSVLRSLSGVDAVITDPPYSSGGAFRADRTASTVDKYVNSGSERATYISEFAGDNRNQRSFAYWSTLWLTAADDAANPAGD